jgi:hypothetical protein
VLYIVKNIIYKKSFRLCGYKEAVIEKQKETDKEHESSDITKQGIFSLLISLMEGTATGKEVITTEDGSQSATAKLFGITRFNMEEDTGRVS